MFCYPNDSVSCRSKSEVTHAFESRDIQTWSVSFVANCSTESNKSNSKSGIRFPCLPLIVVKIINLFAKGFKYIPNTKKFKYDYSLEHVVKLYDDILYKYF